MIHPKAPDDTETDITTAATLQEMAAFAFKTEGQEQAAGTLGLLGLPAGIGYEQVLASLSGGALTESGVAGECIMRDGQARVEKVQIDLTASETLLTALNSTLVRRHSRPERTWRARCGARLPRTASTRSAPGRQTRTGPTGTPRTWWPSRPGRSCRHDRL